jgi:hypothetical protein
MSDGGSFAYLTGDDDGLHVDVVSANGVDRIINFEPAVPCDCPCTLLLYDGVLYGPARPPESHEAMLRLPVHSELVIGQDYLMLQENPGTPILPLNELQAHYAPPGLAYGDG